VLDRRRTREREATARRYATADTIMVSTAAFERLPWSSPLGVR
jgi:hypothetical protein